MKVGIGPGGGCSPALDTNFGVPQVQRSSLPARRRRRVPLIADGGIRRDGALVAALLFGGDTVMLGSAFAGTEETPGEVVHKSVILPESQKPVEVPFKVLRGMASIGAIKRPARRRGRGPGRPAGARRRGPRGERAAQGSARSVLHDMFKHLCSAVSYGGAGSLAELRRLFQAHPERYVIRLSEPGRRESYER